MFEEVENLLISPQKVDVSNGRTYFNSNRCSFPGPRKSVKMMVVNIIRIDHREFQFSVKLPTSLGARKWGQVVPVTPVVNDDDSASNL